MKQHLTLLTSIVLIFIASACSTQRLSPQQKQHIADSIASMVSDSIVNCTFTVEVNYVTPRRMDARFLNSTYTVRVEGDSLISNLPYYGMSYRASLEREGPLDFDGNVNNYSVSKPKPDVVRAKFFTRNKLEHIEYIFDFYADGKCSLDIISADRDKINFLGEMLLNDNMKAK